MHQSSHAIIAAVIRRISNTKLVCLVLTGVSLGCAGGPFNLSGKPGDQWEPEVNEDKWSYVGKDARGNRPIEHENDPLKGLLMSEEARQIERNLGYD